MKIHLTENGEIDFSKVTESLEEINYQIHYLSTQCELEEDEFQANEAELNQLCEIRGYLEGMQKSFQTTFGVNVVELPTQSEQLPDDLAMEIGNIQTWEQMMNLKYGVEGSDTRKEFDKKVHEQYILDIQEDIENDGYEIIHAVPLESTNYQFVAKVPAYNLDNAFVNSQNGFTDLSWIQHFHGIDAKPCRSTSIGDIIGHDGKYFMVKGIGFEEVDSPFPMNEI